MIMLTSVIILYYYRRARPLKSELCALMTLKGHSVKRDARDWSELGIARRCRDEGERGTVDVAARPPMRNVFLAREMPPDISRLIAMRRVCGISTPSRGRDGDGGRC